MHVTASSMWCEKEKGRCCCRRSRHPPVQQGPRGQFPLEATYRNHCRVFVIAKKEKKEKKNDTCTHMKVQFALWQGAFLSPLKKHTITSGSESNVKSPSCCRLTTRQQQGLQGDQLQHLDQPGSLRKAAHYQTPNLQWNLKTFDLVDCVQSQRVSICRSAASLSFSLIGSGIFGIKLRLS